MEVVFIFVAVAFVAVVIRVVAGAMDHERLNGYVAERGGRVIEQHWNPFGRGWFGSQNERIYDVRYEDADGNVHYATCKTSLLAGVYLTEDQIVERSGSTASDDRETQLERENRELREELDRLRAEKRS